MQDNIIIGKYYKAESDIHLINPVSKLLSILFLIFSLFVTSNINLLLIIFTFELIIILISNIPFKVFYKNIVSLKYILIFIIIFNILTKVSIENTLIIIIKLVGTLIYSMLLILTTTPYEIVRGLNIILKPLKLIGVNVEAVSLIISLALRFVPIVLKEAKRIINVLKARGFSSDNTIKQKFIALKSLVLPLYICSFRRADNLSLTMELKGYSFHRNISKVKWSHLDVLLLIIHVIIFLVIFLEVVI